MPDKIELTPDEVAIVLEWAADGRSGFNPTKDEVDLCERLQVFIEAQRDD